MKISVGVIGLGYWGPNYLRNFYRQEQTEVVWGCDSSEAVLAKTHRAYPYLKLSKNYQELINDSKLDCIAVATPPKSHFKIVKESLLAGKHVLVAKPMATNSFDAQELLKIAKKKNLLLHGDLTYLYSGAVKSIKNMITGNIIGKPLYFDSIRTNAGPIRDDASVIWDLAPHDLSIIDFLFNFAPKKIIAVGSRHYKNSTMEEMAHISINYSNNFVAHIHLSWLSPVKLRMISIGGTSKMVFFDDVQMDEKVKIYDNKTNIPNEEITPFKPFYRSGNIIIPKLENEEALFLEIKDVVNQIARKKKDYQNSKLNIKIIKLLEACDQSLKKNQAINL